MKFKIGDRVRFMSEMGGGIIRGFSGKDTVHVEIEEGFEIPVRQNEIIAVSDSPGMGVQDKDTTSNKSREKTATSQEAPAYTKKVKHEAVIPQQKPVIISLACTQRNPESPGGSLIDVFLMNDSLYDLSFAVFLEQQAVTHFHSLGVIEGETQWHIGEFTQSELGKTNAFHIQGMLYHEGTFLPMPAIDKRIDIRDIQFYKQKFYRPTVYFEQPAVLFEVFQWMPNEMKPAGNMAKKPVIPTGVPEQVSMSQSGIHEVDLHIETIDPEWQQLDPAAILNKQLARFRDTMALATLAKWTQVIFIHGVGDGRLKFELRKLIDKQYPDARYQDASFVEYGYGATLVYLE